MMKRSCDVNLLRAERDALVRVSDGLLDVIRFGDVCNLATLARISDDARAAARALTSLIERLIVAAASPFRRVLTLLDRALACLLDVVLDLLTACA